MMGVCASAKWIIMCVIVVEVKGLSLLGLFVRLRVSFQVVMCNYWLSDCVLLAYLFFGK